MHRVTGGTESCHGSRICGWTGVLRRIAGREHLIQDAVCEATKGEVTVGDVRVVEDGADGYGARGRYDPPKL